MTRWLNAAALAVALALTACATIAPPQGARAGRESQAEADAAWARVLDRFVNEQGEVAFAALAQDRADLDLVVRHIAALPQERSTPDEQLAYLINAYNALSMFNVIDSGIPATHAGWAKARFFVLRRFVIGGQAMSLRGFENDVIRPLARRENEPRIHFALNCSARSCPRLPRTPFSAARLREQLDRETRAFFARADNYRVDGATRTLWLSELLDFYAEDFVPAAAPSLAAYASRQVAQPAPADYGVRFIPYDWTIARQR